MAEVITTVLTTNTTYINGASWGILGYYQTDGTGESRTIPFCYHSPNKKENNSRFSRVPVREYIRHKYRDHQPRRVLPQHSNTMCVWRIL